MHGQRTGLHPARLTALELYNSRPMRGHIDEMVIGGVGGGDAHCVTVEKKGWDDHLLGGDLCLYGEERGGGMSYRTYFMH